MSRAMPDWRLMGFLFVPGGRYLIAHAIEIEEIKLRAEALGIDLDMEAACRAVAESPDPRLSLADVLDRQIERAMNPVSTVTVTLAANTAEFERAVLNLSETLAGTILTMDHFDYNDSRPEGSTIDEAHGATIDDLLDNIDQVLADHQHS